MAVLPSALRDTDMPCCAKPVPPPVPTSLPPCWLQAPPLRVYTQAAPCLPLSLDPPMMAVLPSALRDTDMPCCAAPVLPVPTSLLPCCLHAPPLRVYTHAAPWLPLSAYPPTMAVLPSALRDTDQPWNAAPVLPVPTSLPPCWLHTPPLRVYTQAAPRLLLSPRPPTMAVLPSALRDTDRPWYAAPVLAVPTSLPPCWLHTPPLRVYTQAAPRPRLSSEPPTIAVLPSALRDTELP